MRMGIALTAPLAVALLLVGVFLTSPVVSATADVPVWHEGDRWAMGKETDIGAMVGDTSDIEDLLQISGLTLDNFVAEGEAASWIVFEVVGASGTEYDVSVEYAGEVNTEANVQVSGEMPKAGTYSNPNDAPKEQKTVELGLVADFAVVFDGNVIFNKTDLAVKRMSYEFNASMVVSADGTNIPTINMSAGQTEIGYDNYDIDIRFDLNLAVDIDFDPMLDIYDFPLDVGDMWTVESVATVSGTIDGFLDATGLPSEIEQEILTQDLAEQTGITDFPIEFDQLSSDGEDVSIHDGIIESFQAPIYAEMECIDMAPMIVLGHGTIDVYVIEVDGGPSQLYYAPGVQFFTSVGTGLGGIELPEGIPSGLTPDVEIQMDTVDPEEAENGIASVAAYQTQVSEEATGEESTSDGSNFFFGAPYIGIILIVVVILVVIVAVVLIARRK
ncbi:MAG: hypothetical protein LUO84_02300 [Methanomassiliicoccales archaeon]|nr:hypothetical protein [Methanomassiliicoccales archaeon]